MGWLRTYRVFRSISIRGIGAAIFISFLLPIFPAIAKGPIRLSEKLEISSEQVEALRVAFPKLPEDKILYHWTKPEVGERWYRQNGLPQSEVDFYNRPSKDRQAYGAGIYFAEDTESSRNVNFGTTFLTIWQIQKGQPLYDEEIVKKIIGQSLTDAETTELGKRIPFIRKILNQWYITHNAENLSHPVAPELLDFLKSEPQFDRVRAAIDVIAKSNLKAAGYLDSFLHLASYSDGLSLYRATEANPTNPWNEFEPENFERYRQTRAAYLQESHGLAWGRKKITDGHLGFGERGGFFGWESPETFSDNQIELLLKINGDLQGINSSIRNESVRAGGAEAGNRFLATHGQAAALEQNPYLEVHVVPDPKGRGLLAEYYYPDVFHYKKLKGILPDALYQRLNETKPRTLQSDANLRHSLNQEIISELLKHFFRSIHRKPVDFPNVMATLISIHPCLDFNGRAVRIYSEMAAAEMHRMPPHLFESDLDILTTRSALSHNLAGASSAYVDFVRSVVTETFHANSQKRMPIYFQPSIMDPLLQAFHLGEANHKLQVSAEDLELIRNRNMTELYNRHIGLGWDVKAETFDGAYRYAEQTQTLPLFISTVQSSLLRRVEINGDNLALWAKIRTLENHTQSLLTAETRAAQDRIGLKVIQDMKAQISALEDIIKPRGRGRFEYEIAIENLKLFEILNRWKELSKFFEGYPSEESSKLQIQFESLLVKHVPVFAKMSSDSNYEAQHWVVTRRLAMIARFFKGDPRFYEIVKEFAENLPLQGKRYVSYFFDSLASEKPMRPHEDWNEGPDSTLRGMRTILADYADREDLATPLAAALLLSPREALRDAKETDQQTLKDFDALAARLLQTSSPVAYQLSWYALARKFSDDSLLQILESNRLSEDPMRLHTNKILAGEAAPRSVKIAKWEFQYAVDSEDNSWSPSIKSPSKKNDPYISALREFALNPESSRPQGLRLKTRMGLLEKLISNNLEDDAHIQIANDLLLGLSKFDYRSSSLIEALHKKNAIRPEVLTQLTARLRTQLQAASVPDAENAAKIILVLDEVGALNDTEVDSVSKKIARSPNAVENRSLAWLYAIERPEDPTSFKVAEGARDYDSDLLCRWFDRRIAVDEKTFGRFVNVAIKVSPFGAYVDKKVISSAAKVLMRNPDASALWQIAFSQFISGRFPEKDFETFAREAGVPSKATREILMSRVVQEAADSGQNTVVDVWYKDSPPDSAEITLIPERLRKRFPDYDLDCAKGVAAIVVH